MFEIEKTLLKPNIPRTIRFTPILYDWILEVNILTVIFKDI